MMLKVLLKLSLNSHGAFFHVPLYIGRVLDSHEFFWDCSVGGTSCSQMDNAGGITAICFQSN